MIKYPPTFTALHMFVHVTIDVNVYKLCIEGKRGRGGGGCREEEGMHQDGEGGDLVAN